jgi:hypothetical protein
VNEMMVKYTMKYYTKVEPCEYGVKIWCLINAKLKFVKKMEMYCGVGHEDVKHAT